MTIADLIIHLSNGDPSARVVVVDDFGVPHDLDTDHFVFRHLKAPGYWDHKEPKECELLEVTLLEVPRI